MNGTISEKTALSKLDKKASTYRRVVTGNGNGRPVVQSDEQMEPYHFKTVPGYEHTLIWVNTETPDLSKEQRFDHYPDSVVPGPGGTRLELDDSETLHLKRGDVAVQNGTRHAWRNKSTQPVTMLFFLNGARRDGVQITS